MRYGHPLPPSQRASAVLFADNYGLAAAINELGRGMGLPTAARQAEQRVGGGGSGNPHTTTGLPALKVVTGCPARLPKAGPSAPVEPDVRSGKP